jgi:aminotransferase
MAYEFEIPDCIRMTHSSLIRDYSTAVSAFEDGINLTIGQPDFHTPERIKKAAERAIEENRTGYTTDEGILELREAEAAYMKKSIHAEYDPKGEILVTCGATEALDAVIRTVCQKGMEVLVPAPVYCGYDPIIRFAGSVPKYFDTSGNHFVITREMLDQAYTPFTRCLLLASPNNPTGTVMSEQEMLEITQWLLDHPDVFVISDEIYASLTFDGMHRSLASNPALSERVIVISGVSKSYAMTGWRIGFICAPRQLIQQVYKIHQNEVSCAASISQYAALEALQSDKEPQQMCAEYKKRSMYLYHALRDMNMDVVQPGGAFYLFPSIRKFGMSSEQFAERLMEETHIGIVPGSAFSSYGEGYIRISAAASMENLQECIRRMQGFVQSLERGKENGNITDVYESGKDTRHFQELCLSGSLGNVFRR